MTCERITISSSDDLAAAYSAARERMASWGYTVSAASFIEEDRGFAYVSSVETCGPATFNHPKAEISVDVREELPILELDRAQQAETEWQDEIAENGDALDAGHPYYGPGEGDDLEHDVRI